MKTVLVLVIFILVPIISHGLKSSLRTKSKKLLFQTLKYHDYEQLTNELKYLAKKYNTLLTLYKLDEVTHENRNMWVMKISTDKGERSDLKPMVKYIGNIHGNEVVGRELLLAFIEYLAFTYESGTVSWALFSVNKSTKVHISH